MTRSPGLNFPQIVLGRAFVRQERPEAQVHEHRQADDDQRNQEELDGESRCGDQWVVSRGFALDEFFHGTRIGEPQPTRSNMLRRCKCNEVARLGSSNELVEPNTVSTQIFGSVTPRCAWYFPFLSRYDTSHGSSL